MLDIKFIRENPETIKEVARLKQVDLDVDRLLDLDEARRKLLSQKEQIQSERNRLAREVKGRKKPTEDQMELGKQLRNQAQNLEDKLSFIENEYRDLLLNVPNLISEDTPPGNDERDNKVLRSWGKPTDFQFKPLEHWRIGEKLTLIDIDRAAKVTGSRFVYIRGSLAKLQFALIQWVIDNLTDQKIIEKIVERHQLKVATTPFELVIPPVMVRTETLSKMARLEPKDERYHLSADELYLIGSSEHSLGAMHMDEVLSYKNLPLRYLGYSTNFRREAGSYGKDLKGIFRLHQFDKLEMESFTLPKDSLNEQEFLVAVSEYLMQQLEIPYRVVICCTADMGGPDFRHIDIEAWLPGQNRFRETHSADLMTDYQARRLNTKVKLKNGKIELVHMNDATALAISRTLIAILENYQNKDGSITIPKVLRKYFGGDRL